METMAARRHPLRSFVITLFRRGDLVSIYEARLVCDASRQAIAKWLKAERINLKACRLRHIARLRSNAQRQIEGRPSGRPSKAQLRRIADKALRDFNARQ